MAEGGLLRVGDEAPGGGPSCRMRGWRDASSQDVITYIYLLSTYCVQTLTHISSHPQQPHGQLLITAVSQMRRRGLREVGSLL